jgi:GAF domain-containing protein
MAALLLGWQASLVLTGITILAGFGLAYAEQSGAIIVPAYSPASFVRDIAFIFGLNVVLIYLLITGLENALRRSRSNLDQLGAAHATLSSTQGELQHRTAELTVVNEQLETRTRKLHAIAQITRTASSIRDFDQLLPSITRIISKQLGYYHVGLFLLDEQRQFAILRSTNSEAGLKMLSSGYRLPVGQLGLIGFVAQTGQARIALDTAGSAEFFHHPDLPETRSAVALPLKSGNQLIGVLDIQATEADAFVEEDVSILSILADQVGIAIENALLYEQSQRSLQEANVATLQASGRAWRSYTETLGTPGYRYDGIRSEPLRAGQRADTDGEAVFIPVQLRGQTIGRLKLKASDATRRWTDDELAMMEATAERVALALESARLLEEAQKRATRETFLSDVAAKLSTSIQLDSILRDTVQELGQTLKQSTVTFQLVNPSESIPTSEQRSNGSSAVGPQE